MNLVRYFAELLIATLREIFDENAYARFLARESKRSSPAAYADFVEQKHSGAVRRCC